MMHQLQFVLFITKNLARATATKWKAFLHHGRKRRIRMTETPNFVHFAFFVVKSSSQ